MREGIVFAEIFWEAIWKDMEIAETGELFEIREKPKSCH